VADKETKNEPAATNKIGRFRILAGLLLLAILVALVEPTGYVRGILRGETFFASCPASYWANGLQSADVTRESKAVMKLSGGGAEAVDVLVELLGHQDAMVRWKAAEILGKIGPTARSATARLLKTLQDEDPHLQQVAASALARIDGPAEQVVPALIQLCKSAPSVEVTRALSQYGSEAAKSLNVLIGVMENESLPTEVRWNAIRTIGKIRAAAAPAIGKLVARLKDKEATIREHAAEALGDIGPLSEKAVDDLVAVLNDPETRVRRDAVRSLGQIGGAAKTKLPAIKKLIKDKQEIVRKAAKDAIKALSK